MENLLQAAWYHALSASESAIDVVISHEFINRSLFVEYPDEIPCLY